MNYSTWRPHTEKPEHVGVYEIKDYDVQSGGWYKRWDGNKWLIGSFSIDSADASTEDLYLECLPVFQWRGLAEEPK